MEYKTRKREPKVNQRARSLRRGDNIAEALLWNELKGRKLGGFADFLCREARLVVEVDGSQHAGSAYDEERNEFMRRQGYRVLRIWNHDVLKEGESVCRTILAALEGEFDEDIRATDLRYVAASHE